MNILPQITQITQRNAASCIISQRKTVCLRLRLFCCFGFCLRNQRDLRETLGFHLCRLIEYACVFILPQITQITQRNAASCIISQRKTGCLRLKQLLLFWGFVVLGFVCVNLRDLRETLGFYLCVKIEYSCVNILPQITQITQRGMQQAALSRREIQVV